MVEHARKLRAGVGSEVCDEDCPHSEARSLWVEAREMFGDRVNELAFLCSVVRERAAESRPRWSSKPLECSREAPHADG
jgi:hypothetical protein